MASCGRIATSCANSVSRKAVNADALSGAAAAGAACCASAIPGPTARPAANTMAASIPADLCSALDISTPPTHPRTRGD